MSSSNTTTSTPSHSYQDSTLSIPQRVDSLLSFMTLAEKAGQLFHDMMPMGPDGTLADANPAFSLLSAHDSVTKLHMTHFNLLGGIKDAEVAATWYNNLQRLATQETRLGIPITVSTDPRNHFNDNPGATFNAGCFSQWPETLGFAAIGDEKLVEEFADIARQEYVSVGLRVALHPQVDLATEYRWARCGATFGEDAELSGRLGAAYLRGFQGDHDSNRGGIKNGVSCMTKHFPGGGPQKDGEDPHFVYGKEQVYPGGQFEYHLKPFEDLIKAGTRWIMPYYGQPVGLQDVEEVGFAFNKDIITTLLREKMGYKGLVCTDWGLVSNGKSILGQDMPARAWGCEHLSEVERVVKILKAGCDQFGGESRPELVVEAVEKRLISEEDVVDVCVRRLLTEKFELGLFDDPFVDIEAAAAVAGRSEFLEAGLWAQRRSFTLLKNSRDVLPLVNLGSSSKFYVEGISTSDLASHHLQVITDPSKADVALIRLKAPYTPRTGGFESFFHAGTLEFSDEEIARLRHIFATVPTTVVDVYLDRPAVLTPLTDDRFGAGKAATAVLASYGSSGIAFLDVVMSNILQGKSCGPEGKLPFDLPRSMAAVAKSREDVPFDTEDPLFSFGHGLRY